MSDFEDDIDDQLLELAGATEKKQKKRRQHSSGSAGGGGGGGGGSSSKKRRVELDSDSEKEPLESEEDMGDPYPLEGRYRDEGDKRDLLSMTEIRREQILEERAAEKQRLQNARHIADLVRQQRVGASNSEENVSKPAKRQHAARGATKEKAGKLDELKAKRKAKDDKRRTKTEGSPQHRDRSSSPQDMDISDSESEDGQISKQEQEEERLLSLGGFDARKRARMAREEAAADAPCTMADLETCRLNRDLIVKHCVKPWFEEYVRGAWVRYLVGHDDGAPVYRICEISNLAPDFVKPYKIGERLVDQAFELKHGKSQRIFNMDKVSNAPFPEKEYERLTKVCATESVKMPTKRELEKKAADMQKLIDQPMTENDVTAMLARKTQLQAASTKETGPGFSGLDRSRLIQERTLAMRRQDFAEVVEIDAKLEEAKRMSGPAKQQDPTVDVLARVNERNRKANVDAVRRAEMVEGERRRKERKLAAMNGGRTASTPPADPSARLKTVPRTFNPTTTTTRPGTPVAMGSPGPSASATKRAGTRGSFEETLINSVEIDLGDF